MEINKIYEELFCNDDKIAAFDRIAELYYDCNFSSAAKSEIDLLMFSFYMEALIKKNKNCDGVIDYKACSDYEIAKQLGITQDKVRNLKLKKQARYRVEFDWQKSLLSIKDNIRFDGNKRIVIPVTDPNLNSEIRNFINNNGGFVDFESGKDYIRIRTEYYLMLMMETLGENDKKKFIKETKKALNKANQDEDSYKVIDKMEVFQDVLGLAQEGLKVIDKVIQITNPENTLVKVLHLLISRKGF